MAAFNILKDISNKFETNLRRVHSELYSVKLNETFEDELDRKIRKLSILTSKLRLLEAKKRTNTPQITELEKNEQSTLGNYKEVVTWKIIEQQILNSISRSHVVKTIATAPNSQIDVKLTEKKQNIIDNFKKYREQESLLHNLEGVLEEKENDLLEARKRWDATLNNLRENINVTANDDESTGPLHKKLQSVVDKMELMRWLITRLVTSRTDDYDWASDPHNRLRALAMARRRHCIENYIETTEYTQ